MLIAGLTTNVEELHQCIASMSDEIRLLKEQLFLATRKNFGSQSEAFSADQLLLFMTSDVDVVAVEEQKAREDLSSQTRKIKPVRQAVMIGKDSLHERVELDLPETDKHCDHCGGDLHCIGSDSSCQVEYVPVQVKVVETVRPKYGCRQCETGIKQRPAPISPIPKSMATPSLLAFLIVSKYMDHQPLNRIQRMLARHDITLPKSTQCDWLMACAALLMRLTALMKQDLLKSPQIFTDDTILPLQNDIPSRNKVIQSRLWVYATQCKTGPPMVLYQFTRTRSKTGPQGFLLGYRGYLQADAYAGYDGLYAAGAKEIACWAHCRRKFFEVAELEQEPGPAHQPWR